MHIFLHRETACFACQKMIETIDHVYIKSKRCLLSLDLLGVKALEGLDWDVGNDGDHLLGVLSVGLPLHDDPDAGWWSAPAPVPNLRVQFLIDLDGLCSHKILSSLDDLLDSTLGLVLVASVVDEFLEVDSSGNLSWSLLLGRKSWHVDERPSTTVSTVTTYQKVMHKKFDITNVSSR